MKLKTSHTSTIRCYFHRKMRRSWWVSLGKHEEPVPIPTWGSILLSFAEHPKKGDCCYLTAPTKELWRRGLLE